jgi:hypothetical protein
MSKTLNDTVAKSNSEVNRLLNRFRYTKPVLHGHKVLYKGKRYWAFEISNQYPYETYEDSCSIIVFDKLYGGIAAWVTQLSNNSYRGDMPYSQQCIDISGNTVKEIVNEVIYWTNWIDRTEK